MRNGFTLMELLGIVILLGVVILVAVPALMQSNKTAEVNSQRDFDKAISTACASYVQVNSEDFQNVIVNGASSSIPVSTLINKGYLKATLENPATSKTIKDENKTLTVTKVNGEITCTY